MKHSGQQAQAGKPVRSGDDLAEMHSLDWLLGEPEVSATLITDLPWRQRLFALGPFLGFSNKHILVLALLGTVLSFVEGLGVALMLPIFTLLDTGDAVLAEQGQSQIISAVDALFEFVGIEPTLLSLMVSAAILVVVLQLFVYGFAVFQAYARNHAIAKCRQRLFDLIMGAKTEFGERIRSGTLYNSIVVESDTAPDMIIIAVQVSILVLKGFIYGAISLAISWQATMLILTVLLLVATVTSRPALRQSGKVGKAVTMAKDSFSRYVSSRLGYLTLVKLSSTEEMERATFAAKNSSIAELRIRLARLQARIQAMVEPVAMLFALAGIYAAVTVLGITLASLGVFIVILFRLLPIARQLVVARQKIVAAWASIVYLARIQALAKDARAIDKGTLEVPLLRKGLVFDDVTFSYPVEGGMGAALENVSITIAPRKITALVGPSGAGKSTLLELIPRLREPTSGRLLFDDVAAQNLAVAKLRAGIGFVTQNILMIDGSVADNIRYGSPDASEKAVRAAARDAFADDFIRKLSDGYDTQLGERGVRLSGGQRQRIALARALLRRVPILLLDEPTSALDAESESAIQAALKRMRDRHKVTIVLIAHRLSTIQEADSIIVLEKGRVLKHGRHEELLKSLSSYREMVRLQTLGIPTEKAGPSSGNNQTG